MYQQFAYFALILISTICIFAILSERGIVKSEKLSGANQYLQKYSGLIERFYIPILLIFFLVFMFSRMFRLYMIPAGIHLDELGMAYDAKCLAEYGTDRHGIRYPVYLQAYGGGQSAMYAYLASICIRIFGYSVQTIRYPAVFCGALCFFASFFLVKEMFASKKWALLGPVFVMITPYFMTSERWALDCNLFLSLATVAFYFYVKAVKSEHIKFYVLSGIFWGITLYTYVISYLVIPIFLVLATLYLMYIKKFDFLKTVALAVPLFMLAFPLVLMQLINMGICPEFSTFLSDFRALPWYRSGEISFANIWTNIFHIKVLLFGGEWLTYNSLFEYGPLYLFSVPLFIYGLVISISKMCKSIKNKYFDIATFVVLFLLISYLIFIMLAGINMYKGNEIFLPFILLMIIAIKHISEQKNLMVSVPMILLCFAIGFLSFANFYFRKQNNEYHMHPLFMSTQMGDMIVYAETLYDLEKDKPVYLESSKEDPNGRDLIVGLYGNVAPSDWVQDGTIQGRFSIHLPEEIDVKEDAVYIISQEWSFVISYLIENGFQSDESFPGYSILYR